MLLASGEHWEPWVHWYEGILEGDPGDEQLELKKALIPNEIWEQGPLAVNLEIKRITAEHFGKATPQAEVMRHNAETDLVEVERTAINPDDILSNSVSKVGDHLGDLRPRLDENQLTALRPVVAFLDRTVADRAELPRRIHDDFERGIRNIQTLLDNGEVSDDMAVTDLQRDLENGIFDLREAFPDIDKMAKARADARIKSLPAGEAEQVRAAAEAAAEISEEGLAGEFREDAGELVITEGDARGEPLPDGDAKFALYRLGGRLLKILNVTEKVIEKSAKLVKNVGIIGGAIWAILHLLGL